MLVGFRHSETLALRRLGLSRVRFSERKRVDEERLTQVEESLKLTSMKYI